MNIFKPRSTAVLVTALLAMAFLATAGAQQLTPDEQAEVDADAASSTQFVDRSTSRGGLTCEGDEVPTDFYFNDFEADNGGWEAVGFGDWEHGEVQPGVFDQCDNEGSDPEPGGAFSGDNAWATILDGCYTNSGDSSILSQTFDFSELEAPIEMTVQQWLHVFGSFDTAELRVNGDQVFFEDGSTASDDWAPLIIDLSAYAGEPSVTIEFDVAASTVVNRSGWYIDDLQIQSCEAPGGPAGPTVSVPTLNTTGLVVLVLSLALAGGLIVRLRG